MRHAGEIASMLSSISRGRGFFRAALVAVQTTLLVASLVLPNGALAADPDPSAEPTPAVLATSEPDATPEPASPVADPTPEPKPDPTPEPKPDPTPEPTPDPTPAPPEQTPDATPGATPDATPSPEPSASAEPTPSPSASPFPTPGAGEGQGIILTFDSGVSAAEQAALVERIGGVEKQVIAPLRMRAVDVTVADFEAALAAYRAEPAVARAEPDKTRVAESDASDPRYDQQWALPKIGWDQVHGVVDPAGSSTLAVVDTGVDAGAADVAGRMTAGFSAFEGSNPLDDPNGHGSNVAAIAAASADNGSGIAGVAYAGVRVMPVQVLGADGTGQDSDIIAGIVWAADHDADVILMAFSNPGYSASLQAAVDYAWSQGAVLVAATGNDGTSTAAYPAGDRGVVGVSATTESDNLWSGSNSGAAAFLGAPGVGVATPGGSITGTSASAAVVAGAAALMRADSGASNGVIVGRLARNADPAGSAAQTGNGRVNLARAIADDSTEAIKPDGAAPVGDGGPYVGPYVVAAITGTFSVAPTSVSANSTTAFTLDFRQTGGTSHGGAGDNDNAQCLVFTLTGFSSLTGASLTNPTGHTWTITSTSGSTVTAKADGTTAQQLHNGETMRLNVTATAPSTAGSRTWSVVATRTAATCQNGTQTFNASVNVVATNPVPTVTSISPSSAPRSSGAFTLTVDGTNFISSSVVRFNGANRTTTFVSATRVTAAIPASDLVTAGSFPITVSNPAPGGGTSNAVNFVVTNQAPSATNDTYSTNEDVALSVAAPGVLGNDSDPNGDALSAVLVTGPSHSAAFALNANGSFSYTPAANYHGPDSFTYRASDGTLESALATVSLTVNPVNDGPVVSAGDDATIDEGSTFSGSGSFADPDADSWTATVNYGDGSGSQPLTLTGKTFNLSHSYADDGVYTVTVTVTDDHTSGSDTVKVTVNNLAPVVTAPANQSGSEATAASFGIGTFSDAPGDGGTLGWLVNVDWGDDSTDDSYRVTTGDLGSRSHTYADNGSYTVTVSVTDKDGDSGTASFTITIANLNPIIDAVTASEINEGSSSTISVTAHDPAGAADTLSYALDCNNDTIFGAAGSSSSGSCAFSQDGSYTVGVRVTDEDGGSATATTTVTVKNVAPAVNAGADATINEGATFSQSGSFTDPGADSWTATVNYGDGSGSQPLTLTGKTFNLSHSYADDGVYTVTVTVTDDHTSGSDTVKVTVNNLAPTANAGGPYSGAWGNDITFNGSATDPAGSNDTLTYAWDFEYSGGDFTTDASGVDLRHPTHAYAAPGTYTVALRVSDEDGGTSSTATASVTIGKRATKLVYAGVSEAQYSDSAALSATLTDDGGGSAQGTPIAGKTVTFTIGSQSTSGSTTGAGIAASSITLTQPAASPGVGSSFAGDTTYAASSDADAFAIKKEVVSLEYSGDTLKSTGSTATSSSTSLRMAAVVREEADGELGNKLNTTQVKFTLYKYTDTLMTTPVGSCMGSVVTTSPGTGTTNCSISAIGEGNYIVKMELVTNGYYSAECETQAVTVTIAGTGFTTGGGSINEPTLSSRSNFGFTVKFLKNGNVQGNSLYIYRVRTNIGYGTRDYNWIIKSNAMAGLAQRCDEATATTSKVCYGRFSGKNNITAVDRQSGVAYSLGGNYSFQVDVTDASEPGSSPGAGPDKYSIRIWTDAGTYYALGQTAAQGTVPIGGGAIPINGGNIQVRS
jgi:PKD repeat protein